MPDIEPIVSPLETVTSPDELHELGAQVQAVLGDLRPTEVVALYNRAYRWDSADYPEEENADLIQYSDRMDNAAVYGITEAICALGKTDIPRFELIATAFADSPLEVDRRESAMYFLDEVTKVSSGVGISLWDRLLRDEDAAVRWEARQALNVNVKDVIDYGNLDDAEALRQTGMTRAQCDQLIAANEAAERGERIFNLGAAAVRKLLDKA